MGSDLLECEGQSRRSPGVYDTLTLLQLALVAEEKLKRVTQWLGDLKRAVGSLNQAVQNFEDKNSVRIEVTDVFEPMLQLLADVIKFQNTWFTGTATDQHCPFPLF